MDSDEIICTIVLLKKKSATIRLWCYCLTTVSHNRSICKNMANMIKTNSEVHENKLLARDYKLQDSQD